MTFLSFYVFYVNIGENILGFSQIKTNDYAPVSSNANQPHRQLLPDFEALLSFRIIHHHFVDKFSIERSSCKLVSLHMKQSELM